MVISLSRYTMGPTKSDALIPTHNIFSNYMGLVLKCLK